MLAHIYSLIMLQDFEQHYVAVYVKLALPRSVAVLRLA